MSDKFLFIITNDTFLDYVLIILNENKHYFDKTNFKVLGSNIMISKIKETSLNPFLSKYVYTDILPHILDQINQDYILYFGTNDETELQYMNDVVKLYPVDHMIIKLESN